MDKLEKYICDRKGLFEEEPPSGHFERMQQKMISKSKQTAGFRWTISIAASVAVLLLGSVIWQHSVKHDTKIIICENAVDMKGCFINKMNAVAGQIELLSKNLDQWDRQQVMADVQNIIYQAENDFENELPKELPDTNVKLILSNYYRQNLESLEMIAKELKDEK